VEPRAIFLAISPISHSEYCAGSPSQ
jgi:hypothetical protein